MQDGRSVMTIRVGDCVEGIPDKLKDFLFKIGMQGNPLAFKRLSFQMLTFNCQSIFFGLEMKSFLVQKKI